MGGPHGHGAHRADLPDPRRRDAGSRRPRRDRSDGFTHGGWQAPFDDPAVGEDRIRLATHPLLLGAGRRLFGSGIAPTTLRPLDVTVTGRGTVLGTYEPAGPVRHAQM